jgi:hypothetical protein
MVTATIQSRPVRGFVEYVTGHSSPIALNRVVCLRFIVCENSSLIPFPTPSTLPSTAIMIIDPVEMLKKTSTAALLPTATATSTALPTVLPDKPEYQFAEETGKRTLWVVFIVMLISSAVFTGLSWRVPVVRMPLPLCGPS